MKKIIHWLPRILAILFILFVSIFALDAFDQPRWFLALLMHLIPSFILILSTIIAWKHAKVGGLIFITIGILMFIFIQFESLIISIPALLIGLLFLI